MNARTYIGACIRRIQVGNDAGKDVFSSECSKVRTQVLSIWPYGIDDQADGHADA